MSAYCSTLVLWSGGVILYLVFFRRCMFNLWFDSSSYLGDGFQRVIAVLVTY